MFWLRVERAPLSAKWIPYAEPASFTRGGLRERSVHLPYSFGFAVRTQELCPDILTFTDRKEPRPFVLTKVVKNDSKVPECIDNYFCQAKPQFWGCTESQCDHNMDV